MKRRKSIRLGPHFWDDVSAAFILGIAVALVGVAAYLLVDMRDPLEVSQSQVVKIEVTTTDGGEATASGVIIAEDGLILTNRHVVADAASFRVTLRDGATYVGERMWVSEEAYDAALVRIRPILPVEAARVSCRRPRVGDEVYAIGHPLGEDWSVTFGHISADRGAYLQTDLNVLPGNSGGGLFNSDGKLIGLPSHLSVYLMGWSVSLTQQTYAVSTASICALLGRSI
ncbi:MAG: trypsin-like serine protease [Actinobacteria bacterium]|nr:trypsin-like serine protease [Actinomycetota bacterium]